MQSINNNAKQIFSELLEMLGNRPGLSIQHYTKAAIFFKMLERGIKAEDQTTNLYSLAQRGKDDKFGGFEMQFLVPDMREDPIDLDELFIYPRVLLLHEMEVTEESVLIFDLLDIC